MENLFYGFGLKGQSKSAQGKEKRRPGNSVKKISSLKGLAPLYDLVSFVVPLQGKIGVGSSTQGGPRIRLVALGWYELALQAMNQWYHYASFGCSFYFVLFLLQ